MDTIQWLCSFGISTSIALRGLRSQPQKRKLASICFVLSSLYNIYLTRKLNTYAHAQAVAGFFVVFLFYHITSIFWFCDIPACETWLDAYKVLYNGRWIGTDKSPIQAGCYKGNWFYQKVSRDVTKQKQAGHQPHQCQSRMSFVYSQIFRLLQLYAFMVFYNDILDLPDRIDFTRMDFSTEKSSYWRRCLAVRHNGMDIKRETMVRTHIAFDWIVQIASGAIGLHTFAAAVFVLIGLDEPDEWPPLFGHPGKVVSLRSFYADFWHHLHYRSYVAYARYIMKALGLCGKTPVTKLILVFLVFSISGFNHSLTEYLAYGGGFPLRRNMIYWWTQAVLIILEDHFQPMYRNLIGRSRSSNSTHSGKMKCVERILGGTWVIFVFFSITPKVFYNVNPAIL